MSIPPPSPTSPSAAVASSSDIAAAALARVNASRNDESESSNKWAKEHEQRQIFRRLVDPGIIRNNDKKTAHEAIDCLLKLCDNILNHPEEEKYRRFKPTNTRIKALIVDPRGTLEYAQELGFRQKVDNFQPFYIWIPNTKNVDSLRIGAFVLREFQTTIVEKEDRVKFAKANEAAAAKAAAEKVRLAFMDDRKTKAMADQLEQERRAAHLAVMARAEQAKSITPSDATASQESQALKED